MLILDTVDEGTASASSYSEETVMAKRLDCFSVLISPTSMTKTVAFNYCNKMAEFSLDCFEDEVKSEINAFLISYEDKVLLYDAEDFTVIIVPTLYPSATMCLALLVPGEYASASDIVKAAKKLGYENEFLLSRFSATEKSEGSGKRRLSDPDLKNFINDIRYCFFGMGFLSLEKADTSCFGIVRRIEKLSCFLGCPIEGGVEVDGDDVELTDLPLLTAFAASFLMLARKHALNRCARLSLTAIEGAALAKICFDTKDVLMLSNAVLEWEAISVDKNMHFEYLQKNGEFCVAFHPLRREWSYLGLKQDHKFFD